MKRCPTFHCCRILDFNVFSYELANFKMAQLSSNMKMCYPILVSWNIIVNTFDHVYKCSVDMKWCSLFCLQYSLLLLVKLLSSNSSKMPWINFENLSIMMSNNSASLHEFKQDAGSQMKWCQSSFVTCVSSINIPKLKID